MKLEEFVSQGWQDHANDADGVFGRFTEGVSLVSSPEHLPALSALIVHVAGEHVDQCSGADGMPTGRAAT